MQPTPTSFEFVAYKAELAKRAISFTYRIHFKGREPLSFTERLVLPARHKIATDIPQELLAQLLESLHLILGISYYKLYVPGVIKLPYHLTEEQAVFWSTVYQKGLGEFCYRNKLDPDKLAQFPFEKNAKHVATEYPRRNRILLGIGGGKDSIVAAELLKEQKFPVTSFVLQTQRANLLTDKLVKALALPALVIERYLDEQLFEPHEGSFNGHVPISAVIAFIGSLAGVLYDYRYPIVANEYSSNFGNLMHKGGTINHQWSKSQEFEGLFADYLRRFITPDITYFSLLRPFHEIRIAKMFTKYPEYFGLFTSCNRVAKVHRESFAGPWCGECPKCAFVFALLSAFLPPRQLIGIFGKNLYDEQKLIPLFNDLLGFGDLKPFDCVGTFEETQAALFLASKKFKKTAVVKALIGKIKNGNELVASVLATWPAPLIPASFVFTGMQKALIIGYGREGKATKRYLAKRYPRLTIAIADETQGAQYLDKQRGADIAIRTPGIPKERMTIQYTTATNIFFSAIGGQGRQKNKIIGVTGSKGKSTTASLIYAIIKRSGKSVQLLGNIGGPMLAALQKPVKKGELFVLELSSYQLDDIQASPWVAVVTNLFPEHMNYHGSIEKYYEAKRRIVAFQRPSDFFIFNAGAPVLKDWAMEAPSAVLPFAAELPMPEKEIPLLGEHNRQNVKAAIAAARLLGISDEVIRLAVKGFKPLAHRLELVGTYKDVTFYDDAISTTPESTMEALKSLPNVGTIFLGGQDRGYDFSQLRKAIASYGIKNIVLFPDSGAKIIPDKRGLNVLATRSMKEAVAFAYKHAPAGSICLLSTASPSYSVWRDFEQKGDEFQKWVRKLK